MSLISKINMSKYVSKIKIAMSLIITKSIKK